MAVTRIKNNQITDSTITYVKLAPGTLVGSVFNANLTLNSNVTILGNLTVANSFAQLNSINTYINDPIVVFNNNYAGSPTYDIGMLVNRNLSSLAPYGSVNAAWVWKEADAAFEAIMTTETGTTAGAINNTGFANAKLGNTTVVSGTVTNSLTVGTTLGVTGTSTLDTTNISGVLTGTGNIVAASSAVSTSSTTGALVVVGGMGVAGRTNLGGNVILSSSVDTTSATTGALIITGTGGASIASNLYVGNNMYIGSTSFSKNLTAPAIIAVDNGSTYAQIAMVNSAGSGSSDFAAYADNGTDSGGWVDVGIAGSTFSDGNYTITAPQDGYLITRPLSSTYGGNLVIGTSEAGSYNDIAISVGSFFSNAEVARFHGNVSNGGYLILKQTTAATSSTTGALRVTGGAGISGALYTGGIINAAGNIVAASGTTSSSTTTGALVVAGGAGISGALNVGGTSSQTGAATFGSTITASGNVVAASGTASTNTTTGALVVAGGAGVSGAIYAGSIQNTPIGSSTASTGAFTTLTASSSFTSTGNIVAASGTSSSSTTTGAIVSTGGIGVAGAAYIGGVINVAGAATLQSTLGVTGISTLSGNVVAASGTASTNTTTGALVVVGGAGISGAINVGGVASVTNATESTTSSNGALIVSGGAGITKNLNVGGNAIIAGNLTVQGTMTAIQSTTLDVTDLNITVAKGAASAAAANGAGLTVDGASATLLYTSATDSWNLNKQLIGTGASFSNSTASTSTTTGALVVTGGVGIGGVLQTGGNIVAASGTASGGTTTGALVVSGGIGVSGAINAGGTAVIGGNLYVNGVGTHINSTKVTIQDPIIELNTGANGAAIASNVKFFDSGMRVHFWNPAISDESSAFFGRTADTGHFEWYEFVSPVTGENGNIITGTYGTIKTGQFIAANTTVSTSTSSGALVVSGGTGIAGALNVGGGIQGVIGNVTPESGAFTTLTSSGTFISGGNIVAVSGTASTSDTTGALVVKGGIGVSGNIVTGKEVLVGNTLTVTGTTTLNSTLSVAQAATFTQTGVFNGNLVAASATENTGIGIGALVVSAGGASIAGNAYIGNNLYIGSASYNVNVGTPTIIATDNGVNYAQIALKNTNSYGSSDYAAYSDIGTDAGGWVDMGVAGSGFNDGNYTITKPHDGYLFTKPTDNSYGGNLVISTSDFGSYKDIVIGSGSFHANAEVARFHGNSSNSGTFVVKLPTNNTNTANTGAFQVWGGTSISGNTYHGGATVLNGSQTAGYDTIIRGKNDTTLLWARPSATYDQVLIGNSATASTFVTGAKLQINTTDSILLPTGTSAQRPGSAGGTDTVGMFRYNTTLGAIEYYGGSTPGWNLVSSQFTVIAVDTFTGDGSTVAFTMAGSSTTAAVMVAINGVLQQPTVAYSVSGATLTFTEAPSIGDTIDVRRLTTTQTVTGIASVNGYMQFQVDNNGAYVYTGSSSTTATTYWDTTGGQVSAIANVSVASANTVTTLDSFSSNSYRTAKYIIQVKNGANYQAQEVLVVTDGTTATQVTYAVVQTSGNLGVVAASQSGSTTTLSFIATNATNTVRIQKDYIAI